ncbi:MAG: rhomboid family intramembrane serine protease [Verrucomicrobiales bacterium]
MFSCPVCRIRLARTPTDKGLVWTCARCSGHGTTIAILRKNVEGPFVGGLWEKIREGESIRPRADRLCPSCGKPMGEITEETVTGPVEIDACRRCQFFWFDVGESHQLPALPEEEPEPELPPRVREAIALAEIEAIRLRHEPAAFEGSPPDEWWQILATFVGLPSEHETDGLSRKPFLTWGIGLFVLLTSLLAFGSLDALVGEFGLVPADPFRHGGLTFLTSFLLHGGWFHLVGNVYFLLVFGDNVEDALGHAKYLALLVIATLVGDFCHIAADPASTTPVIGASGGISGVIAFYAFAFPRARIGLLLWYRWVRMSVRWAFVLWIAIQAFGSWQQVAGFGDVSHLAHLGGALAGVVCWLVWRERP